MIALLYCVVGAASSFDLGLGVNGIVLLRIDAEGLGLVYSELQNPRELPMPQSAIEFHRVQQRILAQHDLVPFRFPTLLALEEVTPHLLASAEKYRLALQHSAGCVQMEIEVEAQSEEPPSRSGADYLRHKSERMHVVRSACDQIQAMLSGQVQAWRNREVDGGRRMFALVPRSAVSEFRKALARFEASDVETRLTGPWPATEFMDLSELMAKALASSAEWTSSEA